MFLCSGLLIASKHKAKVFSDFVEFEEYGTWPWDCIGKYYDEKGIFDAYVLRPFGKKMFLN